MAEKHLKSSLIIREMQIKTTLRFHFTPVRMAKIKHSGDSRGKDVTTALAVLEYNPRYASGVIKKLLESAVANAEYKYSQDPTKYPNPENLYVAECFANKGPTMKRVRPRAQGRAYRIEKRMSHITVVLDAR